MYSKRNRLIKPLFTTLLLIIVGLIGISLAFFIDNIKLPTIFAKQQYNNIKNIEFISPSNWTPGTTINKEINYTNNDNVPIVVRISFDEEWISKNGNNLGLTLSDGTKAAILTINKEWILIDGYYYYKNKLNQKETTSNFIDAITFNNNVINETSCNLLDGVKCRSQGDDYISARYKLNIKIETMSFEYYKDIWKIEL